MASIPTPDLITVYLLHLDKPLAHVQHYVGSCLTSRFQRRMHEHAAGRGSALVRAAGNRGIGFTVVRLWKTPDRSLEHATKRAGSYRLKCPICTPGLTAPDILSEPPRYQPCIAPPKGPLLDW